MTLTLPINPTLGQRYQVGSSAEYEFNGSYWTVVQPSAIEIINAVSSSYSTTASHLLGASETASYALTASYVDNSISASYTLTASYVNPLEQAVKITGSLEIAGDLNVVGAASFLSVTASRVIVNQNTITVFGSGSNLPRAGYIAADTASVFASGSFLYNLPVGRWESNRPIVASAFIGTATTASFAINSLTAVSSSHSLRANTSLTAVSSSHSLRANTSLTAVSSSHSLRANSAQTATSASFAPTNINFFQATIPTRNGIGASVTDVFTFTLPVPGTYKITVIARVYAQTNLTNALVFLRTSANAQINESVMMPHFNSGTDSQGYGTMVHIVTTTTNNAGYKVSAFAGGGGVMNLLNDGNGVSKLIWERIG